MLGRWNLSTGQKILGLGALALVSHQAYKQYTRLTHKRRSLLTERLNREDTWDHTMEDSFPASDPPSSNRATAPILN